MRFEGDHNFYRAGGQPRCGRTDCLRHRTGNFARCERAPFFALFFDQATAEPGLGLAIVSRIVEDHRGSIRVEENKPVGSRFVIELPVAVETMSTQIGAPAAS